MYTNLFSKILLSSFFSSPTCSFLLSKSPSFCFLWCGLVPWFPGSLALWTTCSVPVPAVCLQVHVLPSGLSAWSWVPGFPSWWSGVVLSLLGLLGCLMNFVSKVCPSAFCYPFSFVY